MITLSQASYDTKELLKWGGLFIGGLVVIIVFIQMILVVKNAIFPTPPPKPTLAFGKLDPQLFPVSVTDKKITYKINTISGYLPSFDNQLKVFKIKAITPDLLSLQNTKDKLAAAGFVSAPTQLSNTNFEWINTDFAGLTQNIKMDIVSNNFALASDLMSNQTVLSKDLTNEKASIKAATDFLTKINELPTDIDTTKTSTDFFSIQNGEFTPVASLSDAKAVEVDFFQGDVNNMPIIYEQPKASSLSIIVGPGGEIVKAQYFHQTPTKDSATYPIKTAVQAYTDLQNGIAYIASYKGVSTSVSINNAYLAYYMSSQTQNFLMPVIVFEGSDNFTAYVPAITDEWINR
jgi:hypothetical protein